MTQQFTASEVRDCIAYFYGDQLTRISAMLRAFADLLEAQEKAVPVATIQLPDPEAGSDEIGPWWDMRGLDRLRLLPAGTNLYIHPAPSDAEKLTEALREQLAKWVGSMYFGMSDEDEQAVLEACANDVNKLLAAHSNLLKARERAMPVVTRESAINAIAHVGRHNGPGRETEARQMLVEGSPSVAHSERLEELGRILRGAMIQGDARVIGKNELKHALEILASAQAQPPATSATKREMPEHE